jgi:hypothetical protein
VANDSLECDDFYDIMRMWDTFWIDGVGIMQCALGKDGMDTPRGMFMIMMFWLYSQVCFHALRFIWWRDDIGFCVTGLLSFHSCHESRAMAMVGCTCCYCMTSKCQHVAFSILIL